MDIFTPTHDTKGVKNYEEWVITNAVYLLGPFGIYTELCRYLYSRRFFWVLPEDETRASDGLELRTRFVRLGGCTFGEVNQIHPGYCTVLEALCALAMKMEQTIMSDPGLGDRTGKWLHGMLYSMHLDGMVDGAMDEEGATSIVTRMLDRTYTEKGDGGLFYIPVIDIDLREVPIWYQMHYYLSEYEPTRL